MLLFDAAHVVGVRSPRRMPGVSKLPCAANRTRRAAADPDLGLTRRHRCEGRVVEGPELAVEVALAAPQRTHDPDRLVAAATATLERHAHEVVLILVPAHSHAEREATAGEL